MTYYKNRQAIFWGVSPAVNLWQISPKEETDNKNKIILMIESGDVRNAMRTLLENCCNDVKKIEFVFVERKMETIARQLLQIALILDKDREIINSTMISDSIQIEEKGEEEDAELFFEIYGNISVREKTEKIIAAFSKFLIYFVTEYDQCNNNNSKNPFIKSKLWIAMKQVVNLSLLKNKHRDDLEGIFKSWKSSNNNLNSNELWNERLQGHFGERYDSRNNIADWDYFMKVKDIAPIINEKEFKKWRNDGNVIEIRNCNHNHPNRTLFSFQPNQSGSKAYRGLWCDIINSPFINFGSWCESEEEVKEYFKKNYSGTPEDKFSYNSMQIAVHNIAKIMKVVRENINENIISFKFILTDEIDDVIIQKCKLTQDIDCLFCGCFMVHRLHEIIPKIMKKKGYVCVETVEAILDISKEDKKLFRDKIDDILVKNLGLKTAATMMMMMMKENTNTNSNNHNNNNNNNNNNFDQFFLRYIN